MPEKSILKPKNWQDFETLCRRLWSEEFRSKFQKNGRNGQKQKGVDIYGIPEGKQNYYGIQCKHKDNGKLTEKEIENEISLAENFKPEIEHLIIASTNIKDVNLEEFVREQDILRRKNNKFGVELYCWEDIEGLLSENYQTYQWYLQNLDVQKRYSIKVCFEDGKLKKKIYPKFFQKINKYVYVPPKKEVKLTELEKVAMKNMQSMIKNFPNLLIPEFEGRYKKNYAWCDFNVIFKNCGSGALKHWELRFYIDPKDGVFEDEKERKYLFCSFANSWKIEYANEVLYRNPSHHPFVQNNNDLIELSVRPNIGIKKFSIKWKLLAEDFNEEGELNLFVEPEIIEKEIEIKTSAKKNVEIEKLPLEFFCDYSNE